ncbi:MAG TPA: alkaline phosphatase family protein, partial [Opitutaceae bacterium]|nr:alkaline phosphatase family protein [Opitutaceae bacterium]
MKTDSPHHPSTAARFAAAFAGALLLAGTALPVAAEMPEHGFGHGTVDHVLLVSVDGLHQSDLAWYVQTHPSSTLAALMARGVDFSNASTPFPSDSFPGMIALATGGDPRAT